MQADSTVTTIVSSLLFLIACCHGRLFCSIRFASFVSILVLMDSIVVSNIPEHFAIIVLISIFE
jgi:hypothetical protein